MKVEVGGPVFEVGWLKNYKEPVQIKVELEFPKYEEEFKLVSKELRLPLDIDTKGYYPVEEQVELLWSKFYVGPGTYADGILTIKLVEAKRHSFTDVVVTNKRILDDKIQCDFALIAENGKFISCHKIFLACHSKVFRRMLEMDCKETKEKACQMSVTEAAVNALLKFLYYSDLEEAFSSSSISLELLQTAHKYDIPSLEKAVKSILLEKSSDWYDLEVVLLLFQYALKVEGYEDLKMKAVKVINSKPYELRASTAYEDLFQKDAESGKELFLLCLNKGD
ncbi:Protein maternal effect lethal 26 [Orchesella cincta]|uniref:Protein maternal effect lethal 26 n=1 Tax=Orchesella cincta TaxID=48709 RepID=A0A1D2M696_ORCCI|nr:Protein maternal effect lethal 26 [Orchesella cincta]